MYICCKYIYTYYCNIFDIYTFLNFILSKSKPNPKILGPNWPKSTRLNTNCSWRRNLKFSSGSGWICLGFILVTSGSFPAYGLGWASVEQYPIRANPPELQSYPAPPCPQLINLKRRPVLGQARKEAAAKTRHSVICQMVGESPCWKLGILTRCLKIDSRPKEEFQVSPYCCGRDAEDNEISSYIQCYKMV